MHRCLTQGSGVERSGSTVRGSDRNLGGTDACLCVTAVATRRSLVEATRPVAAQVFVSLAGAEWMRPYSQLRSGPLLSHRRRGSGWLWPWPAWLPVLRIRGQEGGLRGWCLLPGAMWSGHRGRDSARCRRPGRYRRVDQNVVVSPLADSRLTSVAWPAASTSRWARTCGGQRRTRSAHGIEIPSTLARPARCSAVRCCVASRGKR